MTKKPANRTPSLIIISLSMIIFGTFMAYLGVLNWADSIAFSIEALCTSALAVGLAISAIYLGSWKYVKDFFEYIYYIFRT